MAIPREARRITYSTDIRNRKRIKLDEYQTAIIVGTILGDACLHDNWSRTNSRLQIRHALAQKEYVLWKYKALKSLVLTKPQHYGRTNSVWFRTISHPELTKLQQIFYRDGKKIIPANDIVAFLSSSITIAVWFMDDGNAVMRKGKLCGYNLNTQSFTREENELLAEVFSALYDISCTVERNHDYYRLAIWQAPSRKKFSDLIQEHILPSLKYKISSIGDSSSPVETSPLIGGIATA
jgi:hypothetical protein